MAQKIIKIGNSQGITIPKAMLNDLNLRVGSSVVLEELEVENGLKITKMPQVSKQDSPVKKELEKWLEGVLKEDAEALDELSVR